MLTDLTTDIAMNMSTDLTPDQQSVLAVLARHADCAPATLAPTISLEDLGLDSLKFIMLIVEVEQAVGRPVFNIDSVGNMRTVGDLLMLAQSGKQTKSAACVAAGGE